MASALISETEAWKDLKVILCFMFQTCFGSLIMMHIHVVVNASFPGPC